MFNSKKVPATQSQTMKTFLSLFLIAGLLAVTIPACKTMSRSQKGAVIGGAGGGIIGGVVGRAMGNTAMGAIIGATVGGVTGVVIGRKMDKQAEEIAKEMKDAEVIREGEAIVIRFKEQVLFGYDQYDLNSNAIANLSQLKNILVKYPETNIMVIGHTDSKGSLKYNQRLSERRAKAVTNYTIGNGISADRLTAVGKGETDPIASNDTPEGSASNRRVEFVITANAKMKADAEKEAGK